MRYVAFLRGINVGGNKLVKMEDLRKLFTRLGFKNVSTYKASGNVIFEAFGQEKAIAQKIDAGLMKLMGKETRVVLRTVDYLREIVERDPFSDVKDPSAKRYVTFFEQKITKTKMPIKSEKGDAMLLSAGEREVYSRTVSVGGQYANPLDLIDENFGKCLITTRNWNTVVGIAES